MTSWKDSLTLERQNIHGSFFLRISSWLSVDFFEYSNLAQVFLQSVRRSSESFRSAGSTPQGRLRLLPLSLDDGLNKEVALSSFWIFVPQRRWCSRFLKRDSLHDIFWCRSVFFLKPYSMTQTTILWLLWRTQTFDKSDKQDVVIGWFVEFQLR